MIIKYCKHTILLTFKKKEEERSERKDINFSNVYIYMNNKIPDPGRACLYSLKCPLAMAIS